MPKTRILKIFRRDFNKMLAKNSIFKSWHFLANTLLNSLLKLIMVQVLGTVQYITVEFQMAISLQLRSSDLLRIWF